MKRYVIKYSIGSPNKDSILYTVSADSASDASNKFIDYVFSEVIYFLPLTIHSILPDDDLPF